MSNKEKPKHLFGMAYEAVHGEYWTVNLINDTNETIALLQCLVKKKIIPKFDIRCRMYQGKLVYEVLADLTGTEPGNCFADYDLNIAICKMIMHLMKKEAK